MNSHFDVIVLGAGPGGYVAAIRAAQLGKSVAVIEEKYWGGVCLNVGCIPSKALLRSAELAHLLKHDKAKFGIEGDATVAFKPTHDRSRQVSAGIVRGIHYLMKKNNITEIHGWGRLTGGKSVEVVKDGETTSYTFDNLIIAAGATVRLPLGVALSNNVVSYEEQILNDSLPSSVIIGGTGAIGVEFAYVLANFGVQVTLIEFLDRMLPTEDPDVSKELHKHYRKLGVNVLLSTAVTDVEDTGNGVVVTLAPAGGGETSILQADRFLAAFGFAPRVNGYGLAQAGVTVSDRGAIIVDGRGRTNVEGIYAVGDCTGKVMLAHVAEAMGVVAAETIAGLEPVGVDFDMIPRATYCQPQVASFGYTEDQARERGFDVKAATFPFAANGKAQGLGEAIGFIKVVADSERNHILGAHMIGPDVTELLPVLTLAQKWELRADQVARNVFAHPTLSEAVKEAAEGIAGHMINI